MNKPPKYIINGKPFKSQPAIKVHFQDILRQAVVDEDLPLERFLDCIALFERHPDFAEKRGCGIQSVRVVFNPVYGDRCFWIYRTDGSHTDISYPTCISAKGRTPRQSFMSACRQAIADQVIAFKRAKFSLNQLVKCEISGRLVSEKDSHVDHFVPFVNMVEVFAKTRRIDIANTRYVDKGDGDIVTEFACERLRKQWQDYHRHNCVLQIVHKDENAAKGSRVPF